MDIRRCPPFSSSHPNHCKKNITFTVVRRICIIVEIEQHKLDYLYDYAVNIITDGIKKALEIPQNELRKPKEKKQMKFYHLFLHLIQIIHLYINNAIKNFVEVLKRNNVPWFESI